MIGGREGGKGRKEKGEIGKGLSLGLRWRRHVSWEVVTWKNKRERLE